MEVLAVQLRAIECDSPVSVIVAGELLALLVTATLPAAAPADVGVRLTVNVADCPGIKVVFGATPLSLYPGPETATCEIVIFEFPTFVSVTFCELVFVRATLPKLKLAGLAVRSRAVDMPVPLRGIDRGEPGALLVKVMLPLVFPVELGAKTALNVVLPPAVTLIGTVSPEILNPAPDTPSCVNVSGAVP